MIIISIIIDFIYIFEIQSLICKIKNKILIKFASKIIGKCDRIFGSDGEDELYGGDGDDELH
ncbi:hypothetical protein SASC598J21_000590, partial [Snodgrassella alvi SCGC AB-598-J21]